MARGTRSSRRIISSDEEDDSPRRVKKPVSYMEELEDSDDNVPIEDDEPQAVADEGDYDDAEELSDDVVRPTRKRGRPSRHLRNDKNSEDSDFKEELSDSDGELSGELDADERYFEQLREKQFVASDEEGNDYYGYTALSRRPRRSTRSSRSSRRVAEQPSRKRRLTRASKEELDHSPDEDNHTGSIHQEIQDLYDSSPDQSPIKHKLREREKIDYTIPPPITNISELMVSPQARGRGRKTLAKKSDFRKLLFPTAGPFGGSDVLSLLGQNIPPGGIPIPGMTSEAGAGIALGNDSDSSDDDIIAESQHKPSVSGPPPQMMSVGSNYVNNTKIISALSANDKGKKKNSLSDTDPLGVDMNIDFSAVGGLDGYIDQLKEMVALPLLYPELYQNFGITPPRGVLFHGPPGTGKTLMARALAASCSTPTRKITFFMRKGADCLSKWVGEAERQLRLLFEEARNQQPSIIFFDEIDGLAPVRSSKQEQIHASIVSTLLALMDGMDNRGQVIVIGATNRPDSVDPALRRPGRFDREFYFPLPDVSARQQILKIHTKKWSPPLAPAFIEKIGGLTKGYGGADLRALCTEAALNSIQRKYPQIYLSNDKLQVDPTKVTVIAKDFMRALDKIVPSSQRSTSTGSAPIPERLAPLLQDSLNAVIGKLNDLLPDSVGIGGKKKLTNLEDALYLDPTTKDHDGGFAKQELLKNLESSRICKPHLLICGEKGSGQQYLGAAVLNLLEGFQVQNLDLASIFGDVTRTPELCIVQTFIEARRHQPSIIFIPNIDTWFDVMTYSAKATLSGLLRNLRSNEKILLLGIAERSFDELSTEVKMTLGFLNEMNNMTLTNPSMKARRVFFESVEHALLMKPYEFLNDLENRPKRKLKQLKVVDMATKKDPVLAKKLAKQQEYDDTKLKNMLKIKLAGLMDLFKSRYKRFKKPIIEESFLHHLFEPSILENPAINYEVAYMKADDPAHLNMIKELATGKYFYNMDLDTIEERIWNGYYSEAKQFLKDVRMIVKDSLNSGDRERILKANEMFTNAQFGIDDFNNAEFAKACKELRAREVAKQAKLLEDYKKLQEEFSKQQQANLERLEDISLLNGHDTIPSISLLEDDTQHTPKMNGMDEIIEEIEEEDHARVVELDAEAEHKTEANGSLKESEAEEEDEEAEEEVEEVEEAAEVQEDADDKDVVEADEDASAEDSEKESAATSPKSSAATPDMKASSEFQELSESSEGSPKVDGKNEAIEHDEAVSNGTLNGHIEHEESESEAEDIDVDLNRELIIPAETKHLFEVQLVDVTESYTVEKLEFVMSRLMEIIWADRSAWDKTATVAKLKAVTEHFNLYL